MNLRRDTGTVYCASPRAIAAATLACGSPVPAPALADALIAAHDPMLGSDRSVCLRDVIEALEEAYHPQNPSQMHPADFVTKRFKGDGNEGLRFA